jgi:hypothetical protein
VLTFIVHQGELTQVFSERQDNCNLADTVRTNVQDSGFAEGPCNQWPKEDFMTSAAELPSPAFILIFVKRNAC